mmetsp:Transcript_31980/g.83677  ORF Transcript_31980/g.83677 Transcript_31980/m.83677 type:complete len:200 (-) Transcript_31980:1077-1676(-)
MVNNDHRYTIVVRSDPEHDILGDTPVLLVEEVEDVLLAVAEGPVHADEGDLGKGSDERVQLCVVGMPLAARGDVEGVGGLAEEGALMDDEAILWEDLLVPSAQQLDRRIPREEEEALAVVLCENHVVAHERAQLVLGQRRELRLEPPLGAVHAVGDRWHAILVWRLEDLDADRGWGARIAIPRQEDLLAVDHPSDVKLA